MASCMGGSAAGGLVRPLAGSGRGEVGLSAEFVEDLLLLGSSLPGPGRWSASRAAASASAASSAQVSQSTGVLSIICVSATQGGVLSSCAWGRWLVSMFCARGSGVEGGSGGLLSALLSMVLILGPFSSRSLGSSAALRSSQSGHPFKPIHLSPVSFPSPSFGTDLPSGCCHPFLLS